MRALIITVGLGVTLCGCSGGSTPSEQPPLLSVTSPPSVATPSSPPTSPTAQLLSQGKLSEALDLANTEIQKQPTALAFESRAAVLHKQGKLDAAVQDFTRAIELDPRSPRLLNNRGFLQFSRQQFDAALVDFDAAISLDPHYANAFNNRGLLHIAQGQHRQAVLDLNQAIQANPEYVDAYNNRGFALMQLGKWDRALADFNQALKRDPKYVNAIANRGLVKLNLGDAAGAIFDFTNAMLIDPDNPKYYVHRREAYLLSGSLDKAQQDADKIRLLNDLQVYALAMAEHPEDAQPYLQRAQRWQQQGDLDRALRDLTTAVERQPSNSIARLARATVAVQSKDYQLAEDDCEAVLALGPNQQAYSLRGDCRLAAGQLEEALQDFEAAQRIDSKVIATYEQRSEELAKSGDKSRAEEYHSKATALRELLAEPTEQAAAEIRPIP